MKELRIGLVLYGGVSLAVYMNGVVTEIWNALRGSEASETAEGTAGVYRTLMDDLKRGEGCNNLRIVVDTITGTSAGGVNGVVLGKAIATGADASVLNRTWIEKAGIEELAAPPPARAPLWLRFGDHLMARLNGGFRRVRWSFDETPGIDWAWARDHIYSLFTSDNPEKTPLRGDYFTRMIASTLKEMTDGHAGPKLIPPGGQLDLVLTRTDLYGWSRQLPVDARFHDDLPETAHAHQMRFRFRRTLNSSQPGDGGDFKDDFDLTYAARTTAGFPVAFAPVDYRTAAKSFTQARADETLPDQDTFAARHLPEHRLAGCEAETAWMVDGGILDNKPFSAAIRLIEEKPADRSVYRALMYIEPDPALAESGRTARMPLPREMPGLLYKLFRHEPIFADLHTVAARNRAVERMIKIADAAETDGRCIMQAALAATPRNLERLRVAANGHLRSGNNPAYPGYAALKARRAAETLAGSISEALGYPHESRHGYLLRQLIRAYFRQQGAFDVPEHDSKTGAYNSTASQITLLKAFDVPYRLRRLRYLVRVANGQYGKSGMSAETIDRLKSGLMRVTLAFNELTEWVRGQDAEVRTRLQPEGAAPFDTYIRGCAGGLSELDSAEFPGIDGLCEWLRTHFVEIMYDQGKAVREAISRLPEPLNERLATAYVVYPMIDVAVFPMMDSTGVRDLSTTKVIRVSPHDAKALSEDPDRLKGRELGAFAGFLRRDSRAHDLLWGRLDGAERLIDLIVAAACGDRPALSNQIMKLRTAALNAAIEAILDDSEREGSAVQRDVVADLRKKLRA